MEIIYHSQGWILSGWWRSWMIAVLKWVLQHSTVPSVAHCLPIKEFSVGWHGDHRRCYLCLTMFNNRAGNLFVEKFVPLFSLTAWWQKYYTFCYSADWFITPSSVTLNFGLWWQQGRWYSFPFSHLLILNSLETSGVRASVQQNA